MYSNMAMKSELDTRELLLLESEVKNRGKNMVVAYLLWYFLGYFGAHRFYMGQTGTAVTYLVLCLVGIITAIVFIGFFILFGLFIWWIVDAFLLHQRVKDVNDDVERQVLMEIERRRG